MTTRENNFAEKCRTKYIAPVSEAELACRIIEAMMAVENGTPIPRPAGFTAEQALAVTDPVMREMASHAARAAMTYWAECISNANASN